MLSMSFGFRGGALIWSGNSFGQTAVALVYFGLHLRMEAELLGDALGADRGLVVHAAGPHGAGVQGAPLLVADRGGLDGVLPTFAGDQRPPSWTVRLRTSHLGLSTVDPQRDVLRFGVGEHVGQGAQPQSGATWHSKTTLGQQRADLVDPPADGRRSNLVDHGQGLVGQTGAQMDQGGQHPVGEGQFILRPGSTVPSTGAPAPPVTSGLTASLPAWREFFDQLAETLARQAAG
ncbi:hypothetical protein AQI95_42785 [Streptomyces yokosukanensis]|uniref:Uncharacterized protein n=1 Tax=Streptomyces yokosukanensis TaxID=67386 RepID=A0A101NMI6_9ACTN|nr:hypothetical protein AQI95_42785 [Streptomyces yokosukanensis]